jgi:hypothetical protein
LGDVGKGHKTKMKSHRVTSTAGRKGSVITLPRLHGKRSTRRVKAQLRPRPQAQETAKPKARDWLGLTNLLVNVVRLIADLLR